MEMIKNATKKKSVHFSGHNGGREFPMIIFFTHVNFCMCKLNVFVSEKMKMWVE